MRNISLFIILISFSAMFWGGGCKHQNDTVNPDLTDTTIRGADLSFVPAIEQYGTQYLNKDSVPENILSILKSYGMNTVRLRLWYNPADAHSSLQEVAAYVQRIRQYKLKVLLSVHYSDTWADPGHQTRPAAWTSLQNSVVPDSVYYYTKRICTALQPDYIQIGNEINNGMLWPQNHTNILSYTSDILKAGASAVRETCKAKIVVHYAGYNGAISFFNFMKLAQVDYDIIGLSYYPIWHGKSLDTLQTNMTSLVNLTGKSIFIAETSYPFTLGWNDYTNNVIGLNSQIIPAYPATSQGQLAFLQALRATVSQVPHSIGFCYWGGEWIAYKGSTATDGSSYENQALFDFHNKVLPSAAAFNK